MNNKIKSLTFSINIFNESDAQFFNSTLSGNDIVFTWGYKQKLLDLIYTPKVMFSRQSISDLENDIKKISNKKIDYINYNPEQWKVSHTGKDEIKDIITAVGAARKLSDKINAHLCFTPDNILLEKYGEKIAQSVDVFTIQMQRYQRNTIKEFREEALRMVSIVNSGKKKPEIFFQISMAPPEKKTDIKSGKEKLVKDIDGKKISNPLQIKKIIEQIETISDIADGIAFIYTEATRDSVKKTILALKHKMQTR